MTTVVFDDVQRLNLAQELLRRDSVSLGMQVSPENSTINIDDVRLARLLSRLNDVSWVILPYFGAQSDHWLLSAIGTTQLDQARTRLERFLTPSYGCFYPEQPASKRFDSTKSEIQRLAAPLFPAGYYHWQSHPRNRTVVLDRIMLWLNLEDSEPRLQQEVIYTYAQLQRRFQEALTSQLWEQATWAQAEIRRRHLTTAENLIFLRLQLLAAQGKWATIWDDKEFSTWADLTVPRSIRTILLTACHVQVLQPYEQKGDWNEALAAFAEARTQLGRLLSGPFHFDKSEVARIVSYQAVSDQDERRLALLEQSNLDPHSEHVLSKLLAICPPSKEATVRIGVLDQAVKALSLQDYATAEQIIPTIAEPDSRTILFIELAFHTQDELISRRAWGSYQALSFNQQETLPDHQYFVADYLTGLKDRLLPSTLQARDSEQPDERALVGISDQALGTWQIISALELRLRKVIGTRYQAHYGQNWEEKLHTDPELLTRWREMQARDRRAFDDYDMPDASLLEFTYLGDLSGMIFRQWPLFQDLFTQQGRTAKRELNDKVTAISRVRNPLAHNRAVPDNELTRAKTYCTELLQQLIAI